MYNFSLGLSAVADVEWLTEEERATWLRLAAVLELLPGVLDAQLARDERLTHYEYFTLAMLSETPDRTLRMTTLARRTNATLARLSRVISRLEAEGFVGRGPVPEDRRATAVTLTPAGWDKVVQAAPGHVSMVRSTVFDPLTAAQVQQLGRICGRLLDRLDPDGLLFGRRP